MAWGSRQDATQRTSITSEVFFESGEVGLSPGEAADVQVGCEFPATPTDNLVAAVYSSHYDVKTFVDGDVNTTNEQITVTGHGYKDEAGPVRLYSSGTLPSGLAEDTDYWINVVDANTITLATTKNGSAVDITAASGGGTHTIQPPRDVVPILEFEIDNGSDPSSVSFLVSGSYRFLVSVRRSGATDTITNADMSYRLDGVSL